jgi:hypothetical protein
MEVKIVLAAKFHWVFELGFEEIEKRLWIGVHLIVLYFRMNNKFPEQL